jgi:uncharacterized protein (TIGR02231 family)
MLLSYVVSGASWEPSYDIRIQTKAQTAQLFYYATVVNQTAEDWRDVHLTLSTAKPSLSARPPPLYTLRVKFRPIETWIQSKSSYISSHSNINSKSNRKGVEQAKVRSEEEEGSESGLMVNEERPSVGLLTADVGSPDCSHLPLSLSLSLSQHSHSFFLLFSHHISASNMVVVNCASL